MASLLSQLKDDIRFSEGLSACMNCGICTAVCPAAAYFDYDPRRICQLVQTGEEQELEKLLKGEEIWMCGQCLSCKARCPRGNVPGYLIQSLRKLSQQSGLFIHSSEGRKQIRLKRRIGHSILETGYCVHPLMVEPETHPEQGPVWIWALEQGADLYRRCGSNYYGEGEGGLRKMAPGVLNELEAIFEETGGLRFWEAIERGAEELKLNQES
ncbi:4Fe-4S dicluster domain-containing protein [Geofilum rhodophaeum]|uniref:4Fe-4S dicluster domain-containing protein n=1 Tax=Geofilum rhodophaeum TaxID=1965019 RepID=UPI000B527F0D|nr:4Fe-4S dicluster domain-containing protein [Geofilum rhodophaeum]